LKLSSSFLVPLRKREIMARDGRIITQYFRAQHTHTHTHIHKMSIRRRTLVLPSSHFLFSQNERIIIIKMSHSNKSPQDKQEQEEDSPRADWLGVTIGMTRLYRRKSWFWFSLQTSTTCREMCTGPLVRVFSLYSSNNKQIQLLLHDNNNAQCICESSW
jgi:hypothetical protein